MKIQQILPINNEYNYYPYYQAQQHNIQNYYQEIIPSQANHLDDFRSSISNKYSSVLKRGTDIPSNQITNTFPQYYYPQGYQQINNNYNSKGMYFWNYTNPQNNPNNFSMYNQQIHYNNPILKNPYNYCNLLPNKKQIIPNYIDYRV